MSVVWCLAVGLCSLVVFAYLMCYVSSDCECCVVFGCWVVLACGVCIFDVIVSVVCCLAVGWLGCVSLWCLHI